MILFIMTVVFGPTTLFDLNRSTAEEIAFDRWCNLYNSDFASSYLSVLHTYIAYKSSNMEKFQENLKKLRTVNELVHKTKAWM